MNRRRFTQAVAAALVGIRGCREPLLAEPALRYIFTKPQLYDPAGGFLVHDDFAADLRAASRTDRYPTAEDVRATRITEAQGQALIEILRTEEARRA